MASPLPAPFPKRLHWLWIIPFVLAISGALMDLQFGRAVTWDEAEFFRATDWVAHGRLPYRDFWEHHTPLQWFLFAPARMVGDGSGIGPMLAMRWAQIPMWAATLVVLALLMRRAGASRQA